MKEDLPCQLTVRRGKMKSHIKAVHRDGGFNMKTWIKCGLRSFGRTVKHELWSRRCGARAQRAAEPAVHIEPSIPINSLDMTLHFPPPYCQ